MRLHKSLATACSLAMALAAGAPSLASARTGAVRVQIYKAGFIVGVQGGKGSLTLNNRVYPLSIGGVSLGATIGASGADLIGRAYNLQDPRDIEGTYSAAEMGFAVAGGGKVARLTNSRGVVLELQGRQAGLILSVDLSGMRVRLAR